MLPGLENQTLRTVTNKSAKELYKAIYKSKVRDYLISARKSQIIFIMSNNQYIWSDKWRDTQIINVNKPVYIVEKHNFVRYKQLFWNVSSRYRVKKRLFITI